MAEHLVESLNMLATASVTACVAAGFLVVTSPSLAAVTLVIVPAVGAGGAVYAKGTRQLSKASEEVLLLQDCCMNRCHYA